MESELQRWSTWERVCTGGTSILENALVKELEGMPSRESSLQGEREQLWDNMGAFLRRSYGRRGLAVRHVVVKN